MITGVILKNMRVKAGLTQKQLGEKISVEDNTISSYERGNSQPDLEKIAKIAKTCGYEIVIRDSKGNILTLEKMSREI